MFWCKIINWPYEVSDRGGVRRTTPTCRGGNKRNRMLTPNVNTRGYMVVRLCLKGKRCTRTVHSLVTEAFIGSRPAGMDVHHKDGNKLNNRRGNLEYTTRSANIRHAYATGLLARPRGSLNGRARLCADTVATIRELYATGRFRQVDLAARFGIGKSQISSIVRNEQWCVPC